MKAKLSAIVSFLLSLTSVLFVSGGCNNAISSNQPHGHWADQFGGSMGLNESVQAVGIDRDEHLFVGGYFTEAGTQLAHHIAQWDGNAWQSLGEGVNQPVRAIAVQGDQVYIAGDFTLSGNQEVRYIARWNGSSWEAIGHNNVNASVYAVEIDEAGELYIGGSFIFANQHNQQVAYVARWNGDDWEPVGGYLEGHTGLDAASSGVYSMAFGTSGDLYVGGYFAKADGIAVNNIAQWNGTTWVALGKGTNQAVRALAVSQTGEVYAGGSFSEADGMSVNHIARWDGRAWQSLGEGVNAQVNALAIDEAGGVYIGGGFSMMGSQQANRVAYWIGTGWQTLASGVIPYDVMAICVLSNHVYIGGRFDQAGIYSANNLALWISSTSTSVEERGDANSQLVKLYPNPASERMKISFTQEISKNVQIFVYDLFGREVLKLADEIKNAGLNEIELNISGLASGRYFVCLRSDLTENVQMIFITH